MGQAPTNQLTAVLTSNNASNIVSSCSSTARNYPSIGKFETKTASTTFQFTTGSNYSTGTPLNFTLTVTDTYGKTNSIQFNFTKPGVVSGLDFTATKTEIDLAWNSLSGVGGYNIYRCNVGPNDSESGSYVKLNTAPVSFSFFNDKGLAQLTKYYYKITTVSSSGMESDAVRILAWTSYGSKYRYPVSPDPTVGRIFSPISIADVNMDGKKEIFANTWLSSGGNKGWLMGFDYEGNELFDIDNNVTTVSGFAELDNPGLAIVASADIKREGKIRIIVPTRNSSNQSNNKLFCYSVEDLDGDHKPDLVWSNSLSYPCIKGAVIANIDNSPDGSMEVIVTPDRDNNPILIYDVDGQLLRSIYSGVAANPGAIAVADLDGDGDMEIIRACGNGVYVWHHDGTNFISNKQPVYSNPAYNLHSSVVVCDLKGDGQKVILTSAYQNNNGIILAIDKNGNLIDGWKTGSQSIPYAYYAAGATTQEIAVGDLYGNGELKVVVLGSEKVKVWNRDGSLLQEIPVSNLSPKLMTPLLADVDGDNEAEIIFSSINNTDLYAYKASTGGKALGFPLRTGGTEYAPAIADVDGDGKNELLIGGINMFETNGRPDRIEWGSERHDPRNTGEYFKICEPTIIQANTTWNTSRSICGDIIVKSGTLTINNGCSVTMNNTSSIIVMAGATLKVDNGNLLNCNVNVLPQGNLIQDNNGYIKIRNNAEFSIHLGATWSVLTSGTVE